MAKKCCQIIQASGRQRARIFSEGLLGDAALLMRLGRYWLRVVANSPGRSNLESCHHLIGRAWVCKPDFGLEASRDGSRHSVILYPFGIIGEGADRYLRVPLRFVSPVMKQASQCFLSFWEFSTDFHHPPTGMWMAESFEFNDEIRRVLDQYRDLMVVCILAAIAGDAISYGAHFGRDRQESLRKAYEKIIQPFLSKHSDGLGPKTLRAWRMAIREGGVELVRQACGGVQTQNLVHTRAK